MKKFLAPLSLVALTFFLSGCEKDDICDGGASSTPRVVIEFFDIDDPSKPQNVVDLKVVGAGQTEGLIFNESETDEDRYLANTNTIAVPLKTTAGSTKYAFIYNADAEDTNQIYTDSIEFNYTTNEVYVSRACGFKKEFDLLPRLAGQTQPVVLNDNPNSMIGSWIQDIRVVQYHIEDETETHIYILF